MLVKWWKCMCGPSLEHTNMTRTSFQPLAISYGTHWDWKRRKEHSLSGLGWRLYSLIMQNYDLWEGIPNIIGSSKLPPQVGRESSHLGAGNLIHSSASATYTRVAMGKCWGWFGGMAGISLVTVSEYRILAGPAGSSCVLTLLFISQWE